MDDNYQKKIRNLQAIKAKVPKKVKKSFERKTICYVLITCNTPTAHGEMEVEMVYEGDKDLAGYMVENARDLLDDRF